MLDVENLKTILQIEVDKREKAKALIKTYRASGNRSLAKFYEGQYISLCSQYDRMCDMLHELGYLVWSNDDNNEIIGIKKVK